MSWLNITRRTVAKLEAAHASQRAEGQIGLSRWLAFAPDLRFQSVLDLHVTLVSNSVHPFHFEGRKRPG